MAYFLIKDLDYHTCPYMSHKSDNIYMWKADETRSVLLSV